MRFDKITLKGLGPFSRESTLDLAGIPGVLVAIAGGNGQGKSTLLECLAGALYRETPTRGRVETSTVTPWPWSCVLRKPDKPAKRTQARRQVDNNFTLAGKFKSDGNIRWTAIRQGLK